MMYGCSDIAGDGHAVGFEGRMTDVYRLSQGHHIKSVKNLTTFKILIDFQKRYRLSTATCVYGAEKQQKTRGPGGLGFLFAKNRTSYVIYWNSVVFSARWAVFLCRREQQFTGSHSVACILPRSVGFYGGVECLHPGGEKRRVAPLKREIRETLFLGIEKPPTRGG